MARLFRARVTGKGQIQVPKAVRDALGVDRGDDLVFRVAERGVVYVTRERRPTLAELSGCLRGKVTYRGREAEREAIHEYVAEREKERSRSAARDPGEPGDDQGE